MDYRGLNDLHIILAKLDICLNDYKDRKYVINKLFCKLHIGHSNVNESINYSNCCVKTIKYFNNLISFHFFKKYY